MARAKKQGYAAKKENIYNFVSKMLLDRVEAAITTGKQLPWDRPYHATGLLPQNYLRKTPYRGGNLFLLLLLAGRKSPYYLTQKQIIALGGTIKGAKKVNGKYGEKFVGGEAANYYPIIYRGWNELKDKKTKQPILDENGRPKGYPVIRFYKVWNAEQIEGIDFKYPEVKTTQIDACETLDTAFTRYIEETGGMKYEEGKYNSPCYIPSLDKIEMPLAETFKSTERYYKTKMHEFVHSTGHKKRLNRKGVAEINPFDREKYGYEELVAEMGASFGVALAGLENQSTIDNAVAYMQGWLRPLKSNPHWLIDAAQDAQKAVDLIMGVKFDKKKKDDSEE